MPQSKSSITRVLAFVFLLSLSSHALAQSKPAQPAGAQGNGSARIAWEGKQKITRYRLQLARDEQFADIVFDKLITGREYTVTELAPGKYFWRVAPAAGETGAYSKSVPVTISLQGTGTSSNVSQPTFLTPPSEIGWRTATGMIEQPLAAKLRAGANLDLVGVNNYGMVYAISGENGVALWSARYRPDAKKGEPVNSDGSPPFTPLLIEGKDGAMNVLIAFAGGVRAIEGATGRELWRAALPGDAMTGIALGSEGGGAASFAVLDDSKTLSFLKADSGQVLSQTKLEGFVVGKPSTFEAKGARAILLSLNNGTLEALNLAGVSTLAIKIDSAITTAPLLVRAPRGQLVMIGTESGLVALNAADLTPLWRVATEGDAPQGMLAAADLDGDGMEEVVMVTRRGRTVAVSLANGKIKWYAEGATDAAQAAFADVNGDGTPDVLVAGGQAFALGFSGKDGTLIWKADETAPARAASSEATPLRGLQAARFSDANAPLLIGTDPARAGLRSVGLPAGALK
jgi:outer membrane protein assembly factor BamB